MAVKKICSPGGNLMKVNRRIAIWRGVGDKVFVQPPFEAASYRAA